MCRRRHGRSLLSVKTLQRIFDAAGKLPKAIIFFDEIHGLVTSGNEKQSVEVTTAFKELISSSRYPGLTVVAATTDREYNLYIRTDSALERRFTPIHVKAPTREEEAEAVSLQARQIFEDRAP